MKPKAVLFLTTGTLAAFALGQTVAGGLSLTVNGKTVPGKTIVANGEAYVPLSALRAAGATTTVSGKTLNIGLPSGGANQIAAVEGKVGDWLMNGVWRFKVVSVSPNDDGRPGWKVKVELRNATKAANIALGGTGMESVLLVMADATQIKPYNITDLDAPVGQGGSNLVDLVFYDDEGNGRKPEKLILRIVPDASAKGMLKAQGAAYSAGDPSFRVDLR